MLERSDAAFVGRAISHPVPESGIRSSATLITYTFEVETVVKGDIGETVEVLSPALGASCGFEFGVPDGERSGILINMHEDGTYRGGLCSTLDPDVLIEAGSPPAEPDGEGPLKYLVGGTFGEERVIALDKNGRPIAYGYGEETTNSIAVCPGGESAVEYYTSDDSLTLGVRDLATFEIVDAVRPLEVLNETYGGQHNDIRSARLSRWASPRLVCRNEAGTESAFVFERFNDRGDTAIISVSMGPEPVANVIARDYVADAAFSPDGSTVYIVNSYANTTGEPISTEYVLRSIDLETGDRTDLATFPKGVYEELVALSVAPGNQHVAALMLETSRPWSAQLVMVDVSGGAQSTVLTTPLETIYLSTALVWTDHNQVVVVVEDEDMGPQVYDTSLNLIATGNPVKDVGMAAWSDGQLHAFKNNAFRAAELTVFDLDDGAETVLRKYDNSSLRSMVIVSPGPGVDPNDWNVQRPAEPPADVNGGTEGPNSNDAGGAPESSRPLEQTPVTEPREQPQIPGPGEKDDDSGTMAAVRWSAISVGSLATLLIGTIVAKRMIVRRRSDS